MLTQSLVQFPKKQKTGIGAILGAVEFQPHTRVKTQPKNTPRNWILWMYHFPSRRIHFTC